MAGIKKTRKAARKRVTKRRRSGLKIKSTAKKLLRRMFRMRGGEGDYTATINKLAYCAVSVHIKDTEKVVYLTKYPPAGGTKSPDMDIHSSKAQKESDMINKEAFTKFWRSPNSNQLDGNWKGGAWGDNNLTLLSKDWLSGAFIGDEIQISKVADGTIKYSGGKPHVSTNPIIDGTANAVWSVNVTINGQQYGAYMTDNIMPQFANDVLFIWETTYTGELKDKDGKSLKNSDGTIMKGPAKFIKLLKRGKGPNVDMPGRIMPGAGEHLEPGTDVSLKSGVLRSIKEEIGIPAETLVNAYLLDLGTFDTPGRDPRYWTFNIGGIIAGIQRGSNAHGYVVYIPTDSQIAPKETPPEDTTEVEKKWWANYDKVANTPEQEIVDKWMIKDHTKMFPIASNKMAEFKLLSDEEKEPLKLL